MKGDEMNRFGLTALVLLIAIFTLTACERGDDEEAAAGDPFGIPIDTLITQYNLQDDVDVLVDPWGIPHIYARNDHDAWYVQGYLAAKDRFFQMDLARRLGTGRLGEVLGEIPLLGPIVGLLVAQDIDLYYRAIFSDRQGRAIADALLETLDPQVEEVLAAYAEGVNAWLYDVITMRHGMTEPPAYEGLVNPEASMLDPWSVRDTLALLVVSMWSASNSVDQELAMGEALLALGPEQFADFFRAQPDDPTTVLPNGAGDITPASYGVEVPLAQIADDLRPAGEALRAALAAAAAAGTNLFAPGMHSNNWAVDGAHSAGGHALLANDPHLSMLNPAYFWLCHVDSKTLGDGAISFAGLSFPGAPGAQIGHNDYIGWAGTSAGYDTYDAYVEELDPANDEAVLFDGESVPLHRAELSQEMFNITLDGTHEARRMPIRIVPHHGPIVPGSCKKGRCISLRWTGAEAGDEMNAFIDVLTATDVEEGLAALAQYRRGPYNWLVADRDGRVGYVAAAELPQRQNWRERPPYLPLPGTGTAEWGAATPDEDLARLVDPAAGYIATANNDIYGALRDNDPTDETYYYYFSLDIGYRAGRIADLLSGRDGGADPHALTLEDMRRFQADNVSLLAQRAVPHLLAAAQARPDLVDTVMQGALDYLTVWDYTTPAGEPDRFRPALVDETTRRNSVAATLFHVWFGHAAAMIFGDEFAAARVDLPGEESESGPQFEARALLNLLNDEASTHRGAAWFDDVETARIETREEILLAAWRAAIDFLSLELGPEMAEWTWGRLHTAEFGLIFEGFTVPDLISPILGPAAADGGNFTVNVANSYGLTEDYQAAHAPAGRMVMEIDGDRFESWAVLPGGQSERYDSPHFQDLFAHYLSGELAPVLYTIDEILPVTVERIKFAPRQ